LPTPFCLRLLQTIEREGLTGKLQGCQMVHFRTKNHHLGEFRRAFEYKMWLNCMAICKMFRLWGTFYGHLVGTFSPFWHFAPIKIWQPW
jgi:hypothetical protein